MPKGKSGSQAGGERVAIQTEDLKGLESLGAQELLAWSLERFGENIALACSFGGEDVVLVDMLSKLSPNPRVFAIDTGRLHEATYEVMEQIREKYGLKLEIYFPSRGEVEELARNKGLYSFRTSLEARKECCRIRKVDPLNRALKGLQAWITGLRRDQSVTRTELSKVEVDGAHGGILKLNPLADWSSEEVWEYLPGPRPESIFLSRFPTPEDQWEDPELEQRYLELLRVRDVATKALEKMRQGKIIGNSLEAEVKIYCLNQEPADFLLSFGPALADLFIVSEAIVEVTDALPEDSVQDERTPRNS